MQLFKQPKSQNFHQVVVPTCSHEFSQSVNHIADYSMTARLQDECCKNADSKYIFQPQYNYLYDHNIILMAAYARAEEHCLICYLHSCCNDFGFGKTIKKI